MQSSAFPVISMLILGCSVSACSIKPFGPPKIHHYQAQETNSIDLGYPNLIPSEADKRVSPEQALRLDFDHATRFLDVLVLEGANQCFPATVKQAKTREERIRKELYGGMTLDAANDLIVQRAVLRQLEAKLDAVRESGACQPAGAEKKPSPTTATSKVDPVKESMKQPPPAGNTNIEVISGLTELLNSDNQFAIDSHKLNPKYRQRLEKAVTILQQHADLHLQLTGHTDLDGDAEHNVKLSQSRANEVASYLYALGLAENRISISPAGSNQPWAPGDGEEVKLVNRRVDVKVLMNQPH